MHVFGVLTVFLEYFLRWNMVGNAWFAGAIWGLFYISELLIMFGMMSFIQNVHPELASKHNLTGDPMADIWQFATPKDKEEAGFPEFN
jgi:hypothetical protein